MGRKSICKELKLGQSVADLKNPKSFVRLISTIWRNQWVTSRMEALGQVPGNPQGFVKVYIFILEISR